MYWQNTDKKILKKNQSTNKRYKTRTLKYELSGFSRRIGVMNIG